MNEKAKIMAVDDELQNLRIIEAMLVPLGYDVMLAASGEEALERIKEKTPDVILLDIMMPRMNGFEVAKKIKENEATKTIPIVMVTALSEVDDRVKALESGADDFLTKPVDKIELKARVQSLVKVKAYNDYMIQYQKKLEAAVSHRTQQLKDALKTIKEASLDTIYRLSRAAEYKDEDTGAHIKRMSNYSAVIAQQLGLNERTVEEILYAAAMHDVGKIGIPDYILLKPAKLDPQEWEVMKQHTIIGANILSGSRAKFIQLGEIIALTHHEKWDGSGYPQGLKGADIPIAGRISALADVFDALTSERSYKKAFTIEKSFEIIKEGRGSHFDPEVVDVFFTVEDKICSIKEQFKDNNESLLSKMTEMGKEAEKPDEN